MFDSASGYYYSDERSLFYDHDGQQVYDVVQQRWCLLAQSALAFPEPDPAPQPPAAPQPPRVIDLSKLSADQTFDVLHLEKRESQEMLDRVVDSAVAAVRDGSTPLRPLHATGDVPPVSELPRTHSDRSAGRVIPLAFENVCGAMNSSPARIRISQHEDPLGAHGPIVRIEEIDPDVTPPAPLCPAASTVVPLEPILVNGHDKPTTHWAAHTPLSTARTVGAVVSWSTPEEYSSHETSTANGTPPATHRPPAGTDGTTGSEPLPRSFSLGGKLFSLPKARPAAPSNALIAEI
jgi:hypothetical protein